MDYISEDEFNTTINSNFTFEKNPHVGLCISGGSDSMALLMLAKQWIRNKSGKLTVFHFDHKMRKNSSKEAQWLKNYVLKLVQIDKKTSLLQGGFFVELTNLLKK